MKSKLLFYDPLQISLYDYTAGQELRRHKHDRAPCHITIVARGSVRIDIFNEQTLVRSFKLSAPHMYDFDDGKELDHRIVALEANTVFYNVHRLKLFDPATVFEE